MTERDARSATRSRRFDRLVRLIRAGGLSAALIGAGQVALCVVARGQDQGGPPAKDTIFARKIMMDTISSNMDEIETMTSSPNKISLSEAREHSDVISVMLQAFPHLFPPATDQWKPNAARDAATDTFASPEVWTRYSDFYARADAASHIALDASRAANEAEFRTLAAKLRTACDGCHAAYQKPD
jgi:cytochrome c556